MNISFHTGKTAMIAQGKALDIYGNNIANINTVGYQTIRPDFADCIYETYRRPEADTQTGHGTYIQKTDLMFSESFFNETDRPQDMAIAGEGFFAVQDRWGNINYTRDGKFGITQLDGVWYLVSSQGEYVLDYDNQRIVVPFEDRTRNDILAQLDWNTISGQIGTFTSTSEQTSRIRYEYSGEINANTPARNAEAVKTLTPSAEDPTSATITTDGGYYAVMDDNGEIRYTRDGQLSIQQFEGKWYLGSTAGDCVLDSDNQRIPITFLPAVDAADLESVQRNAEGQTAILNEEGEVEFVDIENNAYSTVQEDDRWYVADAEGHFVLDENNGRILAPIQNGDYYSVDWAPLQERVGVFTFGAGELTTDNNTRFNIEATASQDITKTTGNAMLSAITLSDNEAMFAVEGANGVRYTHSAKFDIMQDEETGNWFLSTAQGEYVLDYNGQRIQVSEAQYTSNVDWAGVHRMVGVFEFPNPFGIEAMGSNRYQQTERSGEAVACRVQDEGTGEWVYTMEKIPYALITSNVNLADQMVKLIETQRAYQLSSRVVTTSDELARISNNLR